VKQFGNFQVIDFKGLPMKSFCVTGWVRQSASTRNTVPENYFREIPQKSWWAKSGSVATQWYRIGGLETEHRLKSARQDGIFLW